MMEYSDVQEDDSLSEGSNNSVKDLGIVSAEGYYKRVADELAEQRTTDSLEKISQFVNTHHISLENFWKSTRNHANLSDIKQFCEGVGIRLLAEDQIDLVDRLFQNKAVVSVNDFVQQIGPWRQHSQHLIIEFMKNRTEKLAETMKKKIRLNSAHTRPKNQPAKQSFQLQSTMAQTTNTKFQRPLSSTHIPTNKSREYLRLQKRKQQDTEKRLEVAINKAKDEYEYELLLKMSEANDLNKQMQSVTTYRAYKNAQGNLKVRVFNLDRFQRQLKLEEFQRQFNNLKKKYNQTKKISVWQVLSSGKHGSTVEKIEPLHRNIKKPERQKQLISILTETMNLTNLLKGQLKILKMHGICPKS